MRNSHGTRFFEDFVKLAGSAAGAMADFRHHIEDEVRACVTRFAREMDFVPRDEFEIVEAMAKKSRKENDDLKKRLDVLEQKLQDKGTSSAKVGKSTKKTSQINKHK